MLKTKLLAACACSVLALGLAMPAAAQTAPQAVLPQDDQDDASSPDIVVTGSLIRGAREDGAIPIDVIGADELSRQGSPSGLDLLKNLPTSNGIIGDANQFDARAQGSEGVASVNLRGLGPQRTLVLLNGKRIVSAGTGVPVVDINLIPQGSIGRIEILKDGAAATYGSDAIAGVVNFITRSDQEGFQAQGDYRYIRGSSGDYTGTVSYGHTGNNFQVFASFGYQHRSELRTTDRDFTVQPYANNPQGGFTGGGSPGNFDFNATAPFTAPNGTVFTGISTSGAAAGLQNGVNFIRDLGCEALGGFRSLPGSTSTQLASNGVSFVQANDRCFTNFGQFDNLVEPEDRYQAYVEAKFDLASNLSLKTTALYGSSSTRITTSPSYLPTLPPSANAASGGAGLFQIPTYAPALRDYCALYGAASGCTTAGGVPVAPAFAFPVLFRPFLLGGNPLFTQPGNDRNSAFSQRQSQSVRFTAELDWEISSNLNLDTGFTFSEYERGIEGTDTFGDLLQNALAGFGGTNCAFASTASRAAATAGQTAAQAAATLAALAGTNGCTFFNPFSTGIQGNPVTGAANANFAGTRNPTGFNLAPGAGLINDLATIDNFFRSTRSDTTTRLFVGDIVLSGQSGIELPGGSLSFAIGGQYRSNSFSVRQAADNNLAVNPCPGTPLNPAATCNPQTGALGFLGTNFNRSASEDVYAVFGELQAPVTDTLNLQFSARYENYGGLVGSTFNPQGRARWQVTPWLAIRGGAGTTFRGPPAESQFGQVTSLQVIGTSFRAIDIRGNPNLDPETALTYGGGIVVNAGPFSGSVDYFRYDLNGPQEAEPVSGIVSALFGATGSANCTNPAFAALRNRFTFTAAGCDIANVQRLTTNIINSADVSTSGIDFQGQVKFDVSTVKMLLGVNGTYIINYKTQNIIVEGVVVQPAFDGVGQLNFQTSAYPLPQIKGNVFLQADLGIHNVRLQYNYIDGYTDQRGAAIFGPNTGALAGASVTGGKNIGAFDTLDFTYRVNLPTNTVITLSAQNILNKQPPFARLDFNYDPFTASPLGFNARFGITQRF